MKTRVDLSEYEKMYNRTDAGHSMSHINSVRNFALKLAQKYAPKQAELAFIAATLHDIGLTEGRDGHEARGATMVANDPEFIKNFSPDELNLIVEAVREHRASNGHPQSAIAKIVSDADKASDVTASAFKRAYNWGVQNLPDLNHQAQLIRAANHLKEKFSPDGTGTRTYYPESAQRIIETYQPIVEAISANNLDYLESLLT